MENKSQIPLKTLEELNYFLSNAPKNWKTGDVIKRFQIYEHEYISCVFWENQHFITGTDIVKALTYRFKIQGHEIKNVKKFEEGIFSDLRNLKPGIDSSLEEPKSPFLELLYKHKCIRTQKKQKVFFWYSVPYDRLYQDVLKRDKKRELNGKKSNIVIDKTKSPIFKKEINKSPEPTETTEITMSKSEVDTNSSVCPNIIYTKWVDETQKLSSNYEDDVKVKKEECVSPQLKKVKKGKKYIIAKYFAKGQMNNSSLKFVCDKKDCNKKFKKLEELVKHKKFVHGADKISYNYSKDFMYVEKNLSFDKSDKNKTNASTINNNDNLNNNDNNKTNSNNILPPSIELEDENNNNWSVILSPDNSVSSENDESMLISNISNPDISFSSISNPNESMSSMKCIDIKNFTPYTILNKTGNRRDQRLSVSSNATLSNINNSTIYSTANTTADLADSSMNTTFLSNQSISNNSSFIIQSNENSESPITNEDQFKAFYAQLAQLKSDDVNYQDNQSKVLTPLTTSSNVSQSYPAEPTATQSQYVPVSNVSVSSVQPQSVNNFVSTNNNVPNVNDVNIPTAHFMAVDSPIQTDGNYYQNIPVQNQTQYISSNTAASVPYVPSMIDASTTASSSNSNYVSYELSSILNNNSSMNVYVTTKSCPDPMNYVSSPTALEYQRINQPQPQPHTSTSNLQNNNNGQSMFYSLSNENNSSTSINPSNINPTSIGQNYIQPQTQYVQVQSQSSQPIYQVPQDNMQPVVQMQYQ